MFAQNIQRRQPLSTNTVLGTFPLLWGLFIIILYLQIFLNHCNHKVILVFFTRESPYLMNKAILFYTNNLKVYIAESVISNFRHPQSRGRNDQKLVIWVFRPFFLTPLLMFDLQFEKKKSCSLSQNSNIIEILPFNKY